MADDSEIVVGVRAEVAQLKSGMAEAAAAVKTTGQQITGAFKEAQTAVETYEDAIQQLGPAAANGSESAIAALEEYRSAASSAVANLRALVSEQQATRNASLEEAAARREAAQASREQAAAASLANRQAQVAATSGVRILEGSMLGANRAAARFATTTLGLGPILAAAFPLVGAVAMVDLIAQLGSRLAKAIEEAEDLSANIQTGFSTATEEIKFSNDELAVTNDKLREAIGKLEGKPDNGIKRAIDEAILSADRLGNKLDSDLKKIADVAEKNSNASVGGFFMRAFTGAASTGQSTQEVQSAIAQITLVQDVQSDLVAKAKETGSAPAVADAVKSQTENVTRAVDAQIQRLKVSLGNLQEMQARFRFAGGDGATIFGIEDQTPNIQMISGVISALQQLRQAQTEGSENATLEQRQQHDEAAHEQEEADRKKLEAQRRADAEMLKSAESTFKQWQLQYGTSGQVAELFWNHIATVARKGSDAERTALERAAEGHLRYKEELERRGDEAAKEAENEARGFDAITKKINEQIDAMALLSMRKQASQISSVEHDSTTKERGVEDAESLGLITEQRAARNSKPFTRRKRRTCRFTIRR